VQSYSWTLSRERAIRLADEEDRLLLAKGRLKKSNVLAYFTDRNADEIVVLPENVFDVEVTELDRSKC